MSGKVGFVSLGCPKALVDSERILSQVRAEGYTLVPSYEDADVVVVNTCGFITPAVEESLEAIGEALDRNGKVVVTGCLGERPQEIMERHPRVLAITGQADVDGVMNALHQVVPPNLDPFTSLIPRGDGHVKLTPRHYSYLKIAEGCNHKCSFCIIPQMRGLQSSRDAADVLAEAYRLVSSGTRELLVIAQNTSAYGSDLRHRESDFGGRPVPAHLVPLVRELSSLGVWVRLHYVYPYPFVRDLLPLMAEGKLLPYLDVPLQHASPRILKAMRRPGGYRSHLETIRQWREICPWLAVRSTFIVGFPGETEEDFEMLLDFLAEARIDRLGAFRYSEVEGAAANELPGKVPEEVKEERWQRLMELQAGIALARNRERVGTTVQAIVDDYGELPGEVVGRTVWDAPEIDGTVLITTDGTVRIGDVVEVELQGAEGYDLRGRAVRVVPLQTPVPRMGFAGPEISRAE